jgi:hypothetical protein
MVGVYNASTTELNRVGVQFVGENVHLFGIPTNITAEIPIDAPPPKKVYVSWEDTNGLHRSPDLPVPPYPTERPPNYTYVLRVNWQGPHLQTVDWDRTWHPGLTPQKSLKQIDNKIPAIMTRTLLWPKGGR